MIFEVEGPSAVGKTTLINALIRNGYKGIDESPPDKRPLKKSLNNKLTPLDFLRNQLWYADDALARYAKISEQTDDVSCGLLDMGMFHVACYTWLFPVLSGYDWSVYEKFKDYIQKQSTEIKNQARRMIYIDADLKTLCERKENDQYRRRDSHDENIRYAMPMRHVAHYLSAACPNMILILNGTDAFDYKLKMAERFIQFSLENKSVDSEITPNKIVSYVNHACEKIMNEII